MMVRPCEVAILQSAVRLSKADLILPHHIFLPIEGKDRFGRRPKLVQIFNAIGFIWIDDSLVFQAQAVGIDKRLGTSYALIVVGRSHRKCISTKVRKDWA
jgi:hypothetical protein